MSQIEFDVGAWDDVIREVKAGRNVSAIGRGAGDVIADTATGSLGLAVAGGALALSLWPLDTEAGRRLRELVGAGVGVYARPMIDFEESDYELEEGRASGAGTVARIRRASFSFVLVKPTDRTEGLDPLKPRPEGRDRRRRIWL